MAKLSGRPQAHRAQRSSIESWRGSSPSATAPAGRDGQRGRRRDPASRHRPPATPHATGAGRPRGSGGGSGAAEPGELGQGRGSGHGEVPGCRVLVRRGFLFVPEQIENNRLAGRSVRPGDRFETEDPMKSTDVANVVTRRATKPPACFSCCSARRLWQATRTIPEKEFTAMFKFSGKQGNRQIGGTIVAHRYTPLEEGRQARGNPQDPGSGRPRRTRCADGVTGCCAWGPWSTPSISSLRNPRRRGSGSWP